MRTRPRSLATVLLALVASLVPASPSTAQETANQPVRLADPTPSKTRPRPERDPDTVLVKFKPGTSEASRESSLERHGSAEREPAGAGGYVVAEVGDQTPEEAVEELRRDPVVEHAQLNYLRHASAVPNDPALAEGDQEYLKRNRLLAGWDLAKGASAKTIAILDTGIDTDHPDLAARIKPGYNALTNGTKVPDDNGHGTFVAGVAAAITNNNRGVAGVAWTAGIMPIKVLNAEGLGTDADIAEGIRWAADHGASVINLSLGGPGNSVALADAVSYALGKNVVIVAAAGNEGWDVPSYPAAYSGVLAVTATDLDSNFAFFSNYGPWVDVAAPGMNIVSTWLGASELYAIGSGTSFAAPIVSGIAHLVRSQNPSFTRTQVYDRIRNTTRDHGPWGFDPFYGTGRVDAYAALGKPVLAAVAPFAGDALEPNPTPDRATLLTATGSATISPEGDVDWFAKDLTSTGYLNVTVTPPAIVTPLGAMQMDPVVEIYGPNLQLLGSADAQPYGVSETLEVPVPATGRYLIAVRNFHGSRTGPKAVYKVKTTVRSVAGPFFEPPPSLDLGAYDMHAKIADVTGDGRADVLTTTTGTGAAPEFENKLVVIPQLATGGLGAPIRYATSAGAGSSHMAMAVGDLNADSRTDVIVATNTGMDVFYQGTGGLDPKTVLSTTMTGRSIEIADPDLDGDRDVVVAYGFGIGFLRRDGAAWTDVIVTSGDTDIQALLVRDVSSDGLPDLVAGMSRSAKVWRRLAGGGYGAPTVHPVDAPDGFAVDGLAIADANLDGRPDVLMPVFDSINGFLQNAAGGLNAPVRYGTAGVHSGLEAGDLSGDGLPDLITYTNSGLALHTMKAGGGFNNPTYFTPASTGSNTESFAIGDVSGDGRSDMINAAGTEGMIVWRGIDPAAGADAWVRDTTPPDFGVGALIGANVTVEFARPMSVPSFTATTVSLLNAATGAVVAATRTYNAATKTLTIDPSASLARNTAYVVSLAGVKDTAGATLGAFVFRFKTEP